MLKSCRSAPPRGKNSCVAGPVVPTASALGAAGHCLLGSSRHQRARRACMHALTGIAHCCVEIDLRPSLRLSPTDDRVVLCDPNFPAELSRVPCALRHACASAAGSVMSHTPTGPCHTCAGSRGNPCALFRFSLAPISLKNLLSSTRTGEGWACGPEATDHRSKVTMAAHRSAIEPPSAANRSSCDEGKVVPAPSRSA